ncbi:MAG: alpha/beta fold hydrolase [Acidobacteria bacterium]|nr:alpha/beta fold hydrolase [Acidobacteriota bacterium]
MAEAMPFQPFKSSVLRNSIQEDSSLVTSHSPLPITRPSSLPLDRFSGIYQVSPRHFIYIQPWPGGEGKLLYTGEDGQLRALSSAGENAFVGGPGLLLASPAELKVLFGEDTHGNVTRLIRKRNGAADVSAEKLGAYKREATEFKSDGVRLTGTLWTPPDKAPHPALVLIHGSGNTDRNNVLPLSHFLLTHGIALLAYDKRGAGESSGDWRAASLQELAADALAAVQFLAARKDIDPKRIGLLGASQGGWLVPVTASQSQHVAFAITVSGPSMGPAELEKVRLSHDLRSKGFKEADITSALELLQMGNDVARGKQKWETYYPVLRESRSAAWARYVSVPLTQDSWLLEHWRRLPLDFNPAPYITKVRVPLLAIFGGLDHTVLPAENAQRWRTALKQGGNKDYTIKIFPNANHMLLEARTGAENEYPMLQRFVPEFAPVLLDWLRQHGIINE